MSDRHGRALGTGQGFNLGIELLRKRLDDAGAEPGFWLSKDAVRPANPIVGNRKFPIRSGHIVRDGDLTVDFFVGERVFQSIHDEFGHDQAETFGLTGCGVPPSPTTFREIGRVSPIIEAARVPHNFER